METNNPVLCNVFSHAKRLFYTEMGESATGLIYGSGATSSWSPKRSDLDLVILLKKYQLPSFCKQLDEWKKLNLPKLDGFVCIEDSDDLQSFGLDSVFDGKTTNSSPLSKIIERPDLWEIQNRSERLFGNSNSLDTISKVNRHDLQKWATDQRTHGWNPRFAKELYFPTPKDPNSFVQLKNVIWIASSIARTAYMIKSGECISKKEALKFFIESLPKSEGPISLLLENFDQNEDQIRTVSAQQADDISLLCYELLQRS